MRHFGKRLKLLAAVMVGIAAGMLAMPAMGQLLGLNLFPANNPWRQNISQAPVATNSATIIAAIGSVNIHPDWGDDNSSNGTSSLYGIPYNIVHGNSLAKVSVVIDDYPSESDLVAAPIPTNAVIEGDYQNGPNPYGAGYNNPQRGDSHLILWDEDNNVGYEFYGMTRPSDTNTLDGVSHTDGKWHAASESVWYYNTNYFRPLGYTSADAAGLPILTGLVRPDEGLPVALGGQGVINHALRMTLPGSLVAHDKYIFPASHAVSKTGTVPMGARLRLKNTPTVNTLITSLGPQSQIVAHAMQQYGLILADVGSAMYITGASASVNATNGISLVWDMNDILNGLEKIPASDFDVVDLTPAVTNLSQASGLAGNSLTINGYNFSGAAGNIAVFFGKTNVNSFAVISDSQINVSVPAGSGIVDVTVQSGTNEPDTYDVPSYNVHEPIFGYGTSATNAADKFTYLVVPKILRVARNSGNFIVSGTNNNGPGGTYHVLVSTNLLVPRTNWVSLTNASFDGSGNFSLTNPIASTNSTLFYMLRVP